METKFEVIHLTTHGARILLDVVASVEEVSELLETPRYEGAWVAEDRKVLKYGRGEIILERKEMTMRVLGYNHVINGRQKLYELTVINGGELKAICLNEYIFAGYDYFSNLLWTAGTLAELVDIVGKEVAWQCKEHYERYLAEYNLEGAI